jgi:hypothetical protein
LNQFERGLPSVRQVIPPSRHLGSGSIFVFEGEHPMFCKHAVLGFLFSVAALSAAPAFAQERPFFPLVCRFGNLTEHVYYRADGTMADPDPLPFTVLKTAPDGSLEMITQFSFRHSAYAASHGMDFDECAWADRPMSASEPTTIVFVQSPPIWQYTTRSASGAPADSPGEIIMFPLAADWTRCLVPGGYITIMARSVNNRDWGGSVLQGTTQSHFVAGDCGNYYAPRSH